MPHEGPARLLTGSGLAPFAGEALREGGIITELAARSIRLAAPDQALQVFYVNDWEAHLGGLLLGGAFDLGFPWVRPDCVSGTALAPQARLLCAEFAFSKPFFEVTVATYARADDPLVGAVAGTGLAGRTVCRPKPHYAFDVDAATPAAEVVAAETAVACFVRLLQGEVDSVVLLRREAEAVLSQLNLGDQISEVAALATTRMLHVVAPKSSPSGLAYLAQIDAGLEQLMATGAWFRIVAEHQSSRLALVE